ncbi:hypothetical protein CEXT_293151 [Caerostris extrusa]|uniref:Uncharacterized protein n=1 Tax=Caerostris extrusa TaxID=172846 RepID=A0AAV4T161_CAEEX|nr:hypothetical protein CEXT_293151 [Caerostris extrusa]
MDYLQPKFCSQHMTNLIHHSSSSSALDFAPFLLPDFNFRLKFPNNYRGLFETEDYLVSRTVGAHWHSSTKGSRSQMSKSFAINY